MTVLQALVSIVAVGLFTTWLMLFIRNGRLSEWGQRGWHDLTEEEKRIVIRRRWIAFLAWLGALVLAFVIYFVNAFVSDFKT